MTRSRQAPRKNRRYIAVFATLAVFAGLVAVTQVSLAGSRRGHNSGNNLPWCQPTSAAAAAHDHSTEQDPNATPPADAPAGEVAGAAGDGTTGDAPAVDAKAAAAAKATASAAAKAQAEQRRQNNDRNRNCRPTTTPSSSNGGSNGGGNNGGGNNGGSSPGSTTSPSTGTGNGSDPTTSPTSPAAPPPPPALPEPLGNTCDGSSLQQHDGFQAGPRCVTTQFGEVGSVENNPTLLISRAPARARINQPFDIQVSTRNLVRDRFLPAGAGGYYKESSFLTEEGLVRGHFHMACRLLSGRGAQDPAPVPAFFKAVEDGGGGAAPDTVTVTVPGLAATGVAQCAAWAGDGSHRIPMMVRANQIPAFDSVRVVVTR